MKASERIAGVDVLRAGSRGRLGSALRRAASVDGSRGPPTADVPGTLERRSLRDRGCRGDG